MKIVLLDNAYTIRHEFDGVNSPKSPKKWDRRILQYRGNFYTHHDTQEQDETTTHTFVEAEVVSVNVTLGGGQ